MDRERLYNLLSQGKTQEVLREAQRLRKEVYGKCAVVDYFIAKSLCLDRYIRKSKECFHYILKQYPLQPNARQFIQRELASCSREESEVTRVSFADVLNMPIPKAGVGGPVGKADFQFAREYCYDRSKVETYEDLVSEEELQSRLFGTGQGVQAVLKLKSVLGPGYKVEAAGKFLLVFLRTQQVSRQTVMAIATQLNRVADFFIAHYRLRAPDKLLTVYLMPSKPALDAVARKVHGIRLKRETYGYSILADLSLLGLAEANSGQLGTLYHELWHLIVRTDVGDISPWLDEGLASLYSITSWRNNILTGTEDTWRIRDLKDWRKELDKNYASLLAYGMRPDLKKSLPSLRELVSYTWQQFNGGPELNLCQAGINYSLANHLLIYLQERGVLQHLVHAYKERQLQTADSGAISRSDVAIFEDVMGEDISSTERKFYNWFERNYAIALADEKTALLRGYQQLRAKELPAAIQLGLRADVIRNQYRSTERLFYDPLPRIRHQADSLLQEAYKKNGPADTLKKIEHQLQISAHNYRFLDSVSKSIQARLDNPSTILRPEEKIQLLAEREQVEDRKAAQRSMLGTVLYLLRPENQ